MVHVDLNLSIKARATAEAPVIERADFLLIFVNIKYEDVTTDQEGK